MVNTHTERLGNDGPKMTMSFANLTKTFASVRALRVNGEHAIQSNFIAAIVGPNGAGKTTLFNVASGFVKPDSGMICLDGEHLRHAHPHKLVSMGLARTFQEVRLIGELTLKENLMLAFPDQTGESLLRLYQTKKIANEEESFRHEAAKMLQNMDLPHDQKASKCSYGQRKLGSILCAVATRARWILLDEPVSGVASPIVERVIQLLKQLKADGKSVVLIEHDLDFVRDVSDVVFAMHLGDIIAVGPAKEVLEQPEVVASYIG